MKKFFLGLFFCGLMVTACSDEDKGMLPGGETTSAIIKLGAVDYENETTRSVAQDNDVYDRVDYYIMDENGEPVRGIKSYYIPETAEIVAEGLQKGKYTLLVLGVKGDISEDGAVINKLERISDVWLSFPEEQSKPLNADYYYSKTPFEVVVKKTAEGYIEEVLLDKVIKQKRVMGKVSFDFDYNNRYVRTAMTDKRITVSHKGFYTDFSADSVFSGKGMEGEWVLELNSTNEYRMLPAPEEAVLKGNLEMKSRSYRGYEISQDYDFGVEKVEPNRISRVKIDVKHPDDNLGVIFMTRTAYDEEAYGKILQDGEPKEVYTDGNQRRFNTAAPLQVKVTDNGQLMVRFYSPRVVTGMMIKAKIPAVSQEYLDFAYFDSIPAFADAFVNIPVLEKGKMLRTESGKMIEMPSLTVSQLKNAEFKLESEDEYWKKLKQIIHGWSIGFGLYGGDPDQPDGKPNGNWMGIRPVHCREVVAFFLNFTFMIDMPEHEEILRANEDRLYGNGGVNDKVTAETVLAQMKQSRSLVVGLVFAGNGVLGLGGGNVYGAYQQAYLQHYFNTYACEIMFHELGHVMGYNHSSAFTYGPWAQSLMNNFYVNNLSKMPIDSPNYLDSKNNPNLY